MSLCLPMFVNEVFALGIIEVGMMTIFKLSVRNYKYTHILISLQNGLICAIPSIGILMTSSTGKVHDCINRKRWMTTSTLRKLFNSIALLTFAACLAAIAAVVPEGGGGGIILMALITIGSSVGNLCTTGGFLVVHSDMSGPFTGIVFSMTNTLANSAGILAPLLVAKVAPNVSILASSYTLEVSSPWPILIWSIYICREPGLNGTTCSTSHLRFMSQALLYLLALALQSFNPGQKYRTQSRNRK